MVAQWKAASVNQYLANRLENEEGVVIVRNDYAGKLKVAVQLSDSSYFAIQSVISFLYYHSGVERTISIKEGLSLYCKGSKKREYISIKMLV